MKCFRQILTIVLLCVQLPPAVANDVITNVMSPVVSYQFPQDFNSETLTNGGIVSPLVSYQYFEWPGDNVLRLMSSPRVSYFYNFGSVGSVTLSGRVVDSEGTPVNAARVSVSVMDTPLLTVETQPSGSYQFPPLEGGVYVLSASKPALVSDRRVVSLSAQTSLQDFLLRPMPSLPSLQTANSTPPFIVPAPEDIEGSTLKVFDNNSFVAVTEGNKPTPDKMTIVLTHGWIPSGEDDDPAESGINGWPRRMAQALRTRPETSEARVNILVWDWFTASHARLPPEGKTPKQGIALGQRIYETLGASYSGNIHFMGHSLGSLVNAYAADYLHGFQRGRHKLPATAWMSAKRRLHVTVFDDAAISRVIAREVLERLAVQTFLGDDVFALNGYGANVVIGYKNPIPRESAWIDNYPTSVGFAREAAVNACLQKGLLIQLASHGYWESAVNAHGYGMEWYQQTVERPSDSILGFGKSYEYASFHSHSFPSSGDGFEASSAYYQAVDNPDELALDRKASYRECHFPAVGILADAGLDSALQGMREARNWTAGTIRRARDATVEWGERTTLRVVNAVNAFGNEISDVNAQILDLLTQPDLRIYLRTGLPLFPPLAKGPADASNDAYLWLEIAVPSDATLMTFDFTANGDGENDTFAFGIGTTNLFSIETQFLPDGELSAGPVIDVSEYAGRTNEFLFGIVGGTSTNYTVTVEGIRFFSIGAPRLTVAQANGVTTLSWASSASGYQLETTTDMSVALWNAVTNAPMLFDGRMNVTTSAANETRFFRLRRDQRGRR